MAQRKICDFVLNNQHLADRIADAVIKSSSSKQSITIQTSPGRGFMTKKLLAHNASRLLVLERRSSSDLGRLKRLFADYPSAYLHLTADGEPLYDKIRQISQSRQVDDKQLDKQSPITCVLGNHPAQDQWWLTEIIHDVLSTSGLFSNPKSEAFIIFNDLSMRQFINRRQTHRKVFLESIFTHEKILEFDLRQFPPRLPIKKQYPLSNVNLSVGHVVRLSPNKETFGLLHPDRAYEYRQFLRQSLFKTIGLAQFIDNFFPGLGGRTITSGFPSSIRVNELTPEQHLKLFNECISWPEYKTSFFASRSMNRYAEDDEAVAGQ